ncbi:MAG: transporter, family, multidrug resistance protein [Chloroflexota bacterium]|jgi:predicted MFS family arabinose efflux permease|nr:transporter, family, multidrug resistance protein [Chloroflexota bacterium]
MSGLDFPDDRADREQRGRSDWKRVVIVFWVTSMIEGLGVSQVFSFLAPYLRIVGVPDADRAPFVGLFSALIFVVGMPLVPLWGVWADKYSRKVVVVRSCLVEAVVFACVALSREPWQLAVSLLLIGFQLGNTGIMLGAIRDVVPRHRIGTIIAIFGASGPIGFAVGPALGGWLVDGFGWPLSSIFWLSALLSIAAGAIVWFGSTEVRPPVVPAGRVLPLAYGALRSVLGDPTVRRIFAIYGVAFIANQMSRPYQALIVESIVGSGPGLASSIGFVAGTAALVGAVIAPLGGVVGDRIGFRPVLLGSLFVGGFALLAVPLLNAIPPLAVAILVFTAANGLVGAMVFSLLATEVPADRRSQTLNLVYLPLYAAGIIGPLVGGAVSAVAGPTGPFWVGAAVFFVGAIVVAVRIRPGPAAPEGTSGEAVTE